MKCCGDLMVNKPFFAVRCLFLYRCLVYTDIMSLFNLTYEEESFC